MVILMRDPGISIDKLLLLAEELRKEAMIDAIPVIETYQPSLYSFDFEKNCYDKRKIIEDVSSKLSLNKPFILLASTINIYGLESSFCDLELKGCITRNIDVREIKKLVELIT